MSCSRSAVSSAGVRMPRRSWLTLATTVPSAASLALRHSAARNSCCIAASSWPATAISSFGQHRDIVRIERRRPLRIGAERGDAAGDPAHRPHQQEQHRQIDQPAGHPGDQQGEDGEIAGELPQRAAERRSCSHDLTRGADEGAVRPSPGPAGPRRTMMARSARRIRANRSSCRRSIVASGGIAASPTVKAVPSCSVTRIASAARQPQQLVALRGIHRAAGGGNHGDRGILDAVAQPGVTARARCRAGTPRSRSAARQAWPPARGGRTGSAVA